MSDNPIDQEEAAIAALDERSPTLFECHNGQCGHRECLNCGELLPETRE